MEHAAKDTKIGHWFGQMEKWFSWRLRRQKQEQPSNDHSFEEGPEI